MAKKKKPQEACLFCGPVEAPICFAECVCECHDRRKPKGGKP